MRAFCLIVLLLFSAGSSSLAATAFPNPALFPYPEEYRPNVEFWERVYSEWGEEDMVIHDSQNMEIIFEVLKIPGENELLREATRQQVKKRIKEIQQVLMDLHRTPASRSRSKEHLRIYNLYASVSGSGKFADASENIRVQQGIKERYRRGLELMPRYIDNMKKVFQEHGLPEELAYLPLVESSYINESLSRTRAAGIWQFMPGTARSYMKVNSYVDERLDPKVATRGAARYLKRSHELLRNWPLALTSYNHGQQGMTRAVKEMGTRDFMTIVRKYSGRYFGFASRNFYAQYLAACRVYGKKDSYFHNLKYEKPLLSDSVRLTRPLYINTILRHSTLTREELRLHNPALQSSVVYSRRPIPSGYELKLPAGRYSNPVAFITQVRSGRSTKISSGSTPSASSGGGSSSTKSSAGSKTYVVRKGDTLYSIARRFSTTVEKLRSLNSLNHNVIIPGQRLLVGSR